MSTTKDRLIEASAELFQQQGYNATGVKQIVEAAGAPFGSMYHHFPDGKEELGAATVRWSGAIYGQLIELFYPPGADPVKATRSFFQAAADTVRDSGFTEGCPIATVALETATTSEPLRLATADVFESWLAALDGHLVAAGLTRARARKVSVTLFCLLEGAFILARSARDDQAIHTAGQAAATVVADALAERAAHRRK